jgi:hypothetical protein
MSSIVLSGDTSGTVTVAVPAVAGTNTVTIAAQTGTLNAAGPAFSAYASSGTSVGNGAEVIVGFQTEEFDTNNNFASNRFTPTVAGYYQINAMVGYNGNFSFTLVNLNKNGSAYKRGAQSYTNSSASQFGISSLVYLNGSTDYVEISTTQNSGSTQTTVAGISITWFNACLVRGA